MVLFSCRGGFCPLSPAVTIPVDSHHPHFLSLFPQKEPFAWTETPRITSCQVEKRIGIRHVSLLMFKLPLCLTFRLRDSKLLCTIFGQSRMNSIQMKTCVRGRPTGGVSRQLNVYLLSQETQKQSEEGDWKEVIF